IIRSASWKEDRRTSRLRTRVSCSLGDLPGIPTPKLGEPGTSEVSARTEPESHRFDPSTHLAAGTGAGPARHEARNGTPDRKINDEPDNSATQWRPGVEFRSVGVRR